MWENQEWEHLTYQVKLFKTSHISHYLNILSLAGSSLYYKLKFGVDQQLCKKFFSLPLGEIEAKRKELKKRNLHLGLSGADARQ